MVAKVEATVAASSESTESQLTGVIKEVGASCTAVSKTVDAVVNKSEAAITKEIIKGLQSVVNELKSFVKQNSECAATGRGYDEKAEECACLREGDVFTGTRCAEMPGTKDRPAADCAQIKHEFDEAPSGNVRPVALSCLSALRTFPPMPMYEKPSNASIFVGTGEYWLKYKNSVFQVYCDMDYDSGGWTLIESYDLVKHRSDFNKKPFDVNFPRNEKAPPKTASAEDTGWDDFRLPKAQMQMLIGRSTQVHARCDRTAAKSQGDHLTGSISMIEFNGIVGAGTVPFGGSPKYNPWRAKGKIRGIDLATRSAGFYQGKGSSHGGWHAGFDIGGWPGAKSSEDSFTWHDGGLNSNHKYVIYCSPLHFAPERHCVLTHLCD